MEEESSNSDLVLLQRIEQLEQERDELRLDVEQLCMQHSGMPIKIDVSQVHARRIAGLQQEIETLKQKLQECIVKNDKLQDELSEAKQIKASFAELLKFETDKNLELGKDITFFQGEAATAFVERDQALFQLERCLEDKQQLNDFVSQLQEKLKILTADLLQQKRCFQDLQDNANAERESSRNLCNVLQFFWDIRSKVSDCEDVTNNQDKLAILLQDSEKNWTFLNLSAEQQDIHLQVEESGVSIATSQQGSGTKEFLMILQSQLQEETLARKQAEQHSFLLQQKMLNFAEQIKIKLRSFWSIITELKDEIMRISREEEDLADSLMSTLVSLLFRNNCTSQIKENLVVPTKLSGGSVYELADANYRAAVHELNTKKEIATCTESLQGCELEIRDAREALAIAVQGKVAALLLLSQQEERQIFEKNMISDRESKIAQLQKQLLQVSIDKGHALLKVANLTEELEKVQREYRGMQLRHSSCIQNRLSSDQRAQSSRFPVKSWLNSSKKLGSKSIP